MLPPHTIAEVKRILCRHWGVAEATSQLHVRRVNTLGLLGARSHYRFRVRCGHVRFEAFGKVAFPNERLECHSGYGRFPADLHREYANLVRLLSIPGGVRISPTPIELVQTDTLSICLAESLEGYANLSHMLTAMVLRRAHAAARVVDLGKLVLSNLASWQRTCSRVADFPLEAEHTALRERVDETESLSRQSKDRLVASFRARTSCPTQARKGMIHGDLGLRNILVSRPNVAFVDWEALQTDRLSLYDSTYFVVSLLMRCIQIYLRQAELEFVSTSLFRHLADLEASTEPCLDAASASHNIWLARRLAEVHLLSRYEQDLANGGVRSLMRRRRRQVNFLLARLGESD